MWILKGPGGGLLEAGEGSDLGRVEWYAVAQKKKGIGRVGTGE